MPTPDVRTAADYTRSAPSPDPVQAVGGQWQRRLLYWVAMAVLFALLLPLDGPLSRALRSLQLSGDLRREVEALQQFGQGASAVLILVAIWLGDPANRRRLADFVAGYAFTALIVILAKGLIGRPRPKFDDPLYFLGPLGQYPIDRMSGGHPVGVRHAWEVGSGISSDLWSMPSSHTAYAAATAVFVATLYPRLRPLMFALAAFVGVARVLTGAHYPTDVLVGGAIGVFAARLAVDGRWGQRLLERPRPGPRAG
jgi:membrane-associated phospholipid phosphatase